ncbi:hypothetical protein [Nonlabens sp.]|uniref:hypothetical protein n=1 Tax=Nonlabens sp. TaxID=1888209 RepID=UPI003F696C53
MTQLEIDLIDGNFTAADALEIITAVLDKKMNFHKLQRLAKTEKDHSYPSTFENERIKALQIEKDKTINFLTALIKTEAMVEVESKIHLKLNQL